MTCYLIRYVFFLEFMGVKLIFLNVPCKVSSPFVVLVGIKCHINLNTVGFFFLQQS